MKSQLFTKTGDKKSEVTLPQIFSQKIRQDLTQKYFEVEKFILRQPYSSNNEAGKRHSASGIISHRRHKWKTAYGKGLARTPRKIMWRRGTQFYWIGAEVSNTRGGRAIHHPMGLYRNRKINKKEQKIAFASCIASTASKDLILQRYSSLKDVQKAPFVIESLPAKTKDLISALRNIFGSAYEKLFKIKSTRAGKGKKRARTYKSNAGLLIVTGNNEDIKYSGLDVRKVSNLRIKDMYPFGRLTLYTEKALEDLKNVA
jgi:ribosomal protein L4